MVGLLQVLNLVFTDHDQSIIDQTQNKTIVATQNKMIKRTKY